MTDVFDPGTGILDRFVNISYSWLNRIIVFVPIVVRITISIFKSLDGFSHSRFHNALEIIQ